MPRPVVVTDGAWGTQLHAQGLPIGACPEAWNLQHPDRVEAVARSYIEAGSRVILTNTFGANRIALARHGLEDEIAAINRAGVAASRRAAGAAAHVFASMGPTGATLSAGEITASEARAAFAEQARLLAEAGADALVIETMTHLGEAELAVRAAGETGLPVVACMVFGVGSARDGMIREFTLETGGGDAGRGGRGRSRRQLHQWQHGIRGDLSPAARCDRSANLDEAERRPS